VTRPLLIGRAAPLAAIGSALDAAAKKRGSVHVCIGEGGIGKTRVAMAAIELATTRKFTHLIGRAYPVETGVPYALLADACVPLLRTLPTSVIQILSRGGAAELATLFPSWRPDDVAPLTTDASSMKARLHDTFSGFIQRLAAPQPLLLVMENLHWADPSSLELLHFVARQCAPHPLVMLGSWNSERPDALGTLTAIEQSLRSVGVLTTHELEPLTLAETTEFVCRRFDVEAGRAGEAAEWLHRRTGGNPFFIEELIASVVAAGKLGADDAGWHGWADVPRTLPRTIRDALSMRLATLTADARHVATLAAVAGATVPHALLERVTGLDPESLLSALDELLREGIIAESASSEQLAYGFTHPLLQEVVYAARSPARVRQMHARMADALELMYGAAALRHADELAVHFVRAAAHEQSLRAVKYLAAAGASALGRGAAREAVEFLEAALQRAQDVGEPRLIADLQDGAARANLRRGQYARALALWAAARETAADRGDQATIAVLDRRASVAAIRSGDYNAALMHQANGLEAARAVGDERLIAQLQLARSSLLIEIGRGDEAVVAAQAALEVANRLAEPRVLARVHHALQSIAIWRGPSDAAREHGAHSLHFARAAGDRAGEWNAHWSSAMHAGLTGDSAGTVHHLALAHAVVNELRAPLLRIWTAEVEIEYRSGIGEWTEALAVADRAIAEARDFGQYALLPRLLVWSALIRLGRGEFSVANAQIDEAWALSGADRVSTDRPSSVHTVVPAHVGRAAWHMARLEYHEALRVAEAGLAIADRTGYIAWAIHRLMPMAAEASLWIRDWDRAEHYGTRLRAEAERLGHPLGMAWSEACFSLMRMLQGGMAGAIAQLRAASDALDAIPFVEHATRLRRKMVDALTAAGDTPAAIVELKRIHESFAKLGADPALTETRDKLRALGVRPPTRVVEENGAGSLTPREVDIARLVADRRSNKQIGVALDISPRTVSTHLSNIFGKLGVDSRGALTDLVRAGALDTADIEHPR
jgi:DNA-binding CsgD family transcriptional regulator